MTDEAQPDNQQDSGGIVVQAGDKRLHVGKDEAKTILGYTLATHGVRWCGLSLTQWQ